MCCLILMGPSCMAMVIKAPEAVLRPFWVMLLFLRGPRQNGVKGNCSRLGVLEGSKVIHSYCFKVHTIDSADVILVSDYQITFHGHYGHRCVHCASSPVFKYLLLDNFSLDCWLIDLSDKCNTARVYSNLTVYVL